MLKFTIRLIYIPLFLIVGNGLAIYIISSGYSYLWLIALTLIFVSLAFVLEYVAPYDADFNVSHGDRSRDVVHAIVNESSNLLGLMLMPALAVLVQVPSIWPTSLPLWSQLLLAVIVADVGITLVHFFSHRIEVLWRLHAVHHSIKRMYGFNGLMKHPLHQLLETLGGTVPLILMGVPHEVMVLFVVAVILQLLLQHSNVKYFVGPLRYILAVNVVHRFHHLKNAEEGDVNFGLFTTLTDRLLGTAYYDKSRVIASNDIGIEAEPNYPSEYFRQLIQPFRRKL